MEIRGEARHGVVDFIKVFYWKDSPWPTFIVADVALVAGVALLFIFLTRHGETIDAKGLSDRANRTLDRIDTTLAGVDAKKLTGESTALLAELRETNAELRKMLANPAWQKLPEDASAAAAKLRDLVSDPKLGQTIARMERSLSRVDRILGGGEQDLASTIANLRQITDNLRDLTEDAKRYPSNLLFGEPPKPLPSRQP